LKKAADGFLEEARWVRKAPRRSLPAGMLERAVRRALPGCGSIEWQPLEAGHRNSNFKVLVDSRAFVLRIYEHDVSLCRKELDLIRLVGGTVPVPEVIHAEPDGLEELPPFALTRFVEGISYRELRRSGDREAIAQAAFSAGETLAAIGRFTFDKPGWVAPGPVVTKPILEGPDPFPRFVDLCLASPNLQRRMPAALRERTQSAMWLAAPELAELARQTQLGHGDFNKRNLLVRPIGGRWQVAAVLDWEMAVSGSPLADIANFLRYEKEAQPLAEPHFSAGYGPLPEGWRRRARLLDLMALCATLTEDELPEGLAEEVLDLVQATVDGGGRLLR
jgi:fructokinase